MIVNINNFRSKHFESSPIIAYYATKYCCIAGYIASHVVAVRRLCWAYNIILGNCRPITYGSKELTHQGRVTHICFSTIIRLHKKQHGGHFATTCVNEGEILSEQLQNCQLSSHGLIEHFVCIEILDNQRIKLIRMTQFFSANSAKECW